MRGLQYSFLLKHGNSNCRESLIFVARVSSVDTCVHALATGWSPGHVDVIRAKICVKICLLCEFKVPFLTPDKTSVFSSFD